MAQETSQPKAETKAEPKPATAPAAVSTVVKIGDRPFELKNMTAEQGAELYAALGRLPDNQAKRYQQLADDIAAVARQFTAISTIKLPEGMTWKTAFPKYFETIKKGTTLTEGWMQELQKLAIKESGLKGLETINGGLENAGNFIDGLKDGAAAPTNIPGAARNLWGIHSGGIAISPEQARAFGAAYAAAIYQQVDAPDSPAATRRKEMNWFEEAVNWATSYFSLGVMNFNHAVPFVSTFFKAFGNWWSGRGWNWDLAGREVAQELVAEKASFGGKLPSHAELMERSREEKLESVARPGAASVMHAAENIAGVPTTAMANLVTQGGVLRDKDGKLLVASYEHGRITTEPMRGPDGQPMTVKAEQQQAHAGVLPDTSRGKAYTAAYVAGATAVTVAGAAGLHGVAEGVARQTAGGQAAEARANKANEKVIKEVDAQAKDLQRANQLKKNEHKFRWPFETEEKHQKSAAKHGKEADDSWKQAQEEGKRSDARGKAFEAGKFGKAAVEDLADKPKGLYN
ncbi:MAG: hypothetical protein ACK52W_09290, partial [Alphaproteobacteria bacterium]